MSTHITIHPDYEHLRQHIERIATEGARPDARTVYKARNTVYAQTCDGTELNIKAFRQPRFPNNYIYTHMRRSKARRSYENALHLLEIGIDTPQPVAYIENIAGGRLTTSYYISLQLDNCGDMRLWLENREAQNALEPLARFLHRLHHKGVWHKDFSPGNVLYRKDATAPGGFRFYLVDLNRMQFDVYDRDRQMRNLSAIYIESEAETGHFARLYAEASGMAPDDTAADAIHLYQKYLKKKNTIKKLKRLLKP